MTLDALLEILRQTKIPVTYEEWPEEYVPALPYICYLESFTNNFMADGVVYESVHHVQIELYTAKREPQTEAILEAVLSSHSIPWNKTPEWIDTEQMYQILYEVEV